MLHQVRETKYQLLSLKQQLQNCLEQDRATAERRFEKLVDDMKSKIAEVRKNTMKILGDFESNISEEMKEFHQRLEKKYSEKERSIQILLTKTDVTLSKLQNQTKKLNTEELKEFSEQTLAEASLILQDPDNVYTNILNKTLQTEKDNANAIFEYCLDDFLYKISCFGRGSSTDGSLEASTKLVSEFYDVTVPTDKRECDINGSCVMPDGTLMLTDWNNTNIKYLNKEFQVTQTCDLPGIPWAVCCSGTKEVAVTLHFLQRIQFVSLSASNMILADSFKVKNKCQGVFCVDNRIFVSCGGGGLLEGSGQVYVYTRDGNVLETFKIDRLGNHLFSCPQHLTVTKDMSRLYVADQNFGLLAIDLQKKIPEKLCAGGQTARKHAEAKGVCLTDDLNILTCDFILDEVVLHTDIDGTEQSVQVLLDSKYGISNPQSICYSNINSALVVTSGNSNLLQVFKWK